MPPKGRPPAPIDRPLASAYLREFAGWSTAYAPGLSDPSTLRIMENTWVTREGALAIRPALRSVFPAGNWITTNYNARIIGSFESFFLNDGAKAMLFATKEASGEIVFRVARYNEEAENYSIISLEQAGFSGAAGFSSDTKYVRYLQIDNKVFALADSANPQDTVRIFYVGEEKRVVAPREITVPRWNSADSLTVRLPVATWINSADKTTIPAAQAPTAGTAGQPHTGTLISSVAGDNEFNFGYFYTVENELGETAASQMTVVKAKRGWSQWVMETAASAGGPSGTGTTDPTRAADQLVSILPQGAWDQLRDQGAVRWNLYMATWSDTGAVPVEGTLIGSRDLDSSSTRDTHGWVAHTPVGTGQDVTAPLPGPEDRTNYTTPSGASQGAVAGDRLILVNDRQAAAVIRWSSNRLGEYTNFSSSKGGGYKTLTAGNLLIPACVKLWQNPQSVDTLVVLCRGVDGYSTSYYMAPAEVTGQTGGTAIMGFEETTATPGTVSPWGVEVMNQGLYHPLDEQLMKSTASNYNISHKSMTDAISNMWLDLANKQNIVSAGLDSRIYYIVHNPHGAPLEDGCMGNEIWVVDVADTVPVWSRWLIQANSLHRLEIGNKLYMAVVRPDAVFVLDDQRTHDEFSISGGTDLRAIPWRVETNTQGANKAHDAWARLQQVEITLGSFKGKMRYGIRGRDANGVLVEVPKIVKDMHALDFEPGLLPWDFDDVLLVRRDLKEWSLFAESVEEDGEVQPSYGQINLVRYRYTPVSVNVGAEFGSIETFEYGRASHPSSPATSYPNGVPAPYLSPSY